MSALRELAEWLVSLDDPANIEQRKVVSLTEIIPRASQALAAEQWAKGTVLGKNVQWYSDAYPDWFICEQRDGYFVWLEFQFRSRHDTFAEAIAVVEASS